MPSVTVWRELRRVTPDQLELFQHEGDRDTVRAYHACHRRGAVPSGRTGASSWRRWAAMPSSAASGACAPRTGGARGRPGQQIRRGRDGRPHRRSAGAVRRMAGRWLVSRRIAWTPVVDGAGPTVEQAAPAVEDAAVRAALPRAWTGFNNCTPASPGRWRASFSASPSPKNRTGAPRPGSRKCVRPSPAPPPGVPVTPNRTHRPHSATQAGSALPDRARPVSPLLAATLDAARRAATTSRTARPPARR